MRMDLLFITVKYFMKIDSKDINASVDVVSYEEIGIEDAKEITESFLSTNTTLPDRKRLFIEEFIKGE